MRYLACCLLLALSFTSFSQTKNDTVQLIRNTASLYDLDYTAAEADSMIETINGRTQLYKALHKTLPTNDIPFPFAFNPLPFGEKVPTNQQKINWEIPKGVQMPANKN